jgi:hypothetical protein
MRAACASRIRGIRAIRTAIGENHRFLRRFSLPPNPRRNFLQKETKETKVLSAQRKPSSFSSLPSVCVIRELTSVAAEPRWAIRGLKLARLPLWLVATPRDLTFYLGNPISSILKILFILSNPPSTLRPLQRCLASGTENIRVHSCPFVVNIRRWLRQLTGE